MTLETYKRKRDFARTPEPAGEVGRPSQAGGRFVVQRHRATRLHYDFRLEIDGVLMSWAVPKGPTLDPAPRRMAARTEDHPLDYFDFEGVIPAGQYGGGDVIVWDWGTFEPEKPEDPGAAVRKGELKFVLHGQKLRGRYTLVRTSARDEWGQAEKEEWLLIKKRDEHARDAWDAEDHPQSVKSGRTNDEVKDGRDAVWISGAPAPEAAIDLSAARDEALPEFIPPMKATLADRPFSNPDWLYEIKWDGYRVEAVVQAGRVRLWTRNKQDAGTYFPDLAGVRPTWIEAREAIVDGEVVAFDEDGEPNFSLLQERTGIRAGSAGARAASRRASGTRGDIPIRYQVFDLLHLDGRSLLDVPLEARKRLLKSVLREHPLVGYASHISEEGEAFHRVAGERGLEGVVAKHRRSRYEPGKRSPSWLKLKIRREQELVVIGWEPGQGTHKDLGSLLVAVNEDGALVYAGGVGSGIDAKTRKSLLDRLAALARSEPAAARIPRLKDARWVEPEIVIRAEFSDWTTEGYVRQAAYKGLAIDRDPGTVMREPVVATDAATTSAERKARRPPKRAPAPWAPAATATAAAPSPPTRDVPHEFLPATEDELAELEAIRREGRWSVGGYEVRVTNLDKVLFPADGITKRDLIRYYATIAPYILPHLEGRAVNLHRFPEGIDKPGFWQKELRSHTPDWVSRKYIEGSTRRESHVYVIPDRTATLVFFANDAAFEIHPWTSRAAGPDRPTFALIDIDPGERSTFENVLTIARLYRTALDHLRLQGFPKVTGKRGLQIWVPVRPRYEFHETAAWVEALSRYIGAAVPDLVSWEWAKEQRRGLIRLDYTQNAVNKTLVAPYSVRPGPAAPVSIPISWDELDDPALRPDRWTIATASERVRAVGDLFALTQVVEQELPALG